MCCSRDRWGSRPVVWSTTRSSRCVHFFAPPLRKIFRTQSHWDSSCLCVSLPTVPGSETAALLLSRRTFPKKKKKKRNVYKLTTEQRQWKTAWGLSRCADKNSGDVIYESGRACVRQRQKRKNLNILSLCKRVLDPKHLEIAPELTNHPKLNSRPQPADRQIMWLHCTDSRLSINWGWYCASDQRESLIITLITGLEEETETETASEGGGGWTGQVQSQALVTFSHSLFKAVHSCPGCDLEDHRRVGRWIKLTLRSCSGKGFYFVQF